MTKKEKNRIGLLINEAKIWAESNKDYLTGLDNDCEEITVECLTIEEVQRILDTLKEELLKEDEIKDNPEHLRECPYCHSKNVASHVTPGDWGYYPASAYIECNNCGTRSKEYEGSDDLDEKGAILKATVAWNRRRL